ncbi:MAG: efflux RND transporter periplasmic adaptor subunit [Micavibrio sp.]|nr:efflux RND transporter periplasmic adaptor subunit [Micavibrio sp.]
MRKTKIIIAVLVVCAAGAGIWHHYKAGDAANAGKKAQSVLVKTAAVTAADVPLQLVAVGTVVPYQTVAIRSRIDSQLSDVKFHSGDYVHEGDVLFQLDDRVLKTQLDQAAANVQRDKAQQTNLQLQYDRNTKLFAVKSVSQQAVDDSKAALDTQTATLAADAALMESIQVQLTYTVIKAPISGRTGTINLTTGNTVTANDATPLVTINQVKPIWAQISFSQRYLEPIHNAKKNGSVAVTAQHEGNKPVAGRLDYIDNAVDNTTGTFATRVLFDNDDEALWPGMFVTVTLNLGDEKQALTVPEVAVQHGQENDYVYTVVDGKAHRATVKIARFQGGLAIIDSGLKAGDIVTTDGMMKLDDGSAVEVVTPADKSADKADAAASKTGGDAGK